MGDLVGQGRFGLEATASIRVTVAPPREGVTFGIKPPGPSLARLIAHSHNMGFLDIHDEALDRGYPLPNTIANLTSMQPETTIV
jgi:hypothetical protein